MSLVIHSHSPASIDPRGRPQSRQVVITIFIQIVRPSVRSSQQNFKIKRQSLPAGTVGWPSGSLMTPVLSNIIFAWNLFCSARFRDDVYGCNYVYVTVGRPSGSTKYIWYFLNRLKYREDESDPAYKLENRLKPYNCPEKMALLHEGLDRFDATRKEDAKKDTMGKTKNTQTKKKSKKKDNEEELESLNQNKDETCLKKFAKVGHFSSFLQIIFSVF